MPADSVSWLDNRPGPLQDTQPRHVSFTNWNGASKGARPLAPSGKVQLKVPDRKPSVYNHQPQHGVSRQGQRDAGRCAGPYLPPGKSRGTTGRSMASDWNAQKPEVLFKDHSQYLLKHEYKRGMIINAPVHEAIVGKGKARAPSHFESISAWGGVFTKPRYLIVVALHETEYTCIPLYSHNQEGLRGKEHYRNEFVSVRDGRLNGTFRGQSDLMPLETEKCTGPVIDPMSVAWLTHPVSRKYDLNLSLCGRLTQASLDNLIRYLEAATKKGLGLT